jgi:RimJ/RimL family protein N-acetyltransferase
MSEETSVATTFAQLDWPVRTSRLTTRTDDVEAAMPRRRVASETGLTVPARAGRVAIVTLDRISWPRRTARLSIRPAGTADLPAVFAVRSRKDVAEWMPDHPTSYDEWLLRLGRSGAVDRMLVLELDDVVIGDLYLHVEDAWAQVEVKDGAKRAQAEIGWCLSPDHQGKGYVTEATSELVRICFEDLAVRRVVANAFADNEPSLRVMERLGTVCESRSRAESLHRDHGWVDGVTYALLRDDWVG